MSVSLDDFNQYIAALNAHDWQYEYSDDHQVWLSGRKSDMALQAKALHAPEYSQAYRLFHTFHFSVDMSQQELDDEINKIKEALQ